MNSTERFLEARDHLLRHRVNLDAALGTFEWPRLKSFNWASDYFDVIAADNNDPALHIVDDADGNVVASFAQMAKRSSQVSNFMTAQGIRRRDRVLAMLGNCLALWEITLACIKTGAVIIPTTTLLGREDLRDRLERGGVRAVFAHAHLTDRFEGLSDRIVRVAVGAEVEGWLPFAATAGAAETYAADSLTNGDDPLLLYFTSGTTSRPKLVLHSHVSYPVGHLSTMYWLGLKPGDVHLNLSSPGWAKHAWSSFFAPWTAQATVVAYQYERFDATRLLDLIVRHRVTSFCAPPTVWRMLIQHDLRRWPVRIREAASAGEPLNAEIISRVRAGWDVTVRDAYGQTETTAQVGNSPGQLVKPGSMGRPLPGCPVVLLDSDGRPADEGEICVDLSQYPVGLMSGYVSGPELAPALVDPYYRTGDAASRDQDGYWTYIGRMDDVFKSSDYRISPFELESVLLEHPAVGEAAVVPSPEPLRLAVPKAFVVLVSGCTPDAQTALSIFQHVRKRVSDYKRVRRLEFSELPKTISGKIRRVELRNAEMQRSPATSRRAQEFWEEDFAEFVASGAR